MGLHQASFRVRHECPYRALSEAYPDVTVREWPMSDCQVLEITAPGSPTDELLDEVNRLGTVLHRTVDDDGLHVVTQSCLCSLEESILQRFEDHDCLYQPPTVYRQGWEHYTVVAFDERNVRALLRRLDRDRDVAVVSKTALSERQVPHSMLTPVDQLFDGLTDRQRAALRLAIDAGYYEQPRRTSIREMAARTSVSRSTFEEHLRKAENKLVSGAGQFLRLLTATSAENPLGVDGGAAAEGSAD